MKNNILIKQIYCDCRKAMLPCVGFYAFEGIVSQFLTIYTASILGLFADAVLKLDITYGIENLWKILLCVGGSVVVVPFFKILGELSMFKNSLKHDRFILEQYLSKSYDEAMKIGEGETQKRLEDDPIELRIQWVNIITKFMTIPIVFAFLLYKTLPISALFTLIIFVVSIIKFIVPVIAKKAQARYDSQNRAYNTDFRSLETDIIAHPDVVKFYGLSQGLMNRLDVKYQQYYKEVFVKDVKLKTTAKSISSFLDTFCIIVILLIGAVMVAENLISVGTVVAVVGFLPVFGVLFENSSYIIINIPILNNIVQRVQVLYEGVEHESSEEIRNVDTIIADKLSFSYQDGNYVFKDIAFNVKSGEKVAIVGKNGSGKSTFIKLFCGLLKNYTGSLMLNKQELKLVSMKSWRNIIAYTPQVPYLFEGSVQENISLGNLNTSEQEIKNIIEKVGIGHLSERIVTMSQNDLSGGEKQKISIARALLKKPDILILDEPSNNLDKQTTEWLSDFIITFPKTILYISHDTRLITLADKQIYFEL